MKSTLACAVVLLLSGVLTCCGDTPVSSCPGCPLSVTTSPTAGPSALVSPSPTPVPTPSTQQAIPVPTPSPTVMVCTGTPAACSTFPDQATCGKAVGCAFQKAGCTPYICTDIQDQYTCAVARCEWHLVCTGAAAKCSTFNNSVGCNGQNGCEWQASGNFCSGIQTNCSYMNSDVATCNGQLGCGVASSPCNTIDPVVSDCVSITNAQECASTQGCYEATQSCTGTPQACENFSNAEFCTANTGCVWQAKTP